MNSFERFGTCAPYELGPFGEPLRATGSMAAANPFRFSTKYHDDETDLLYYGYRFYNASTGRWIARDPLEEEGFNLYALCDNVPAGTVDLLGLCGACTCKTVRISYTPPLKKGKLRFKFYNRPDKKGKRYGFMLHVHWTVVVERGDVNRASAVVRAIIPRDRLTVRVYKSPEFADSPSTSLLEVWENGQKIREEPYKLYLDWPKRGKSSRATPGAANSSAPTSLSGNPQVTL